jgi:hypothetical protein
LCEHFTPQRTSPDYPTGKSAANLSSPFAKNIPLAPSGKSSLQATPSHPNEGRIAIVTNARWDAMDADSAVDETRMKRTVKSCGPDAPTLAPPAMVATKPGHQGELEVSRKPSRRENRMIRLSLW